MRTIVAALALGLAAAPGAAVSQSAPSHCAIPSQPAQARIHACLAAVAAKGAKPDVIASDYRDLASAYEDWGDRRRELDALSKAITLKPDMWEARVSRAQLYLQTQLFDQAFPDYLALHKAFPGPAPVAQGGKIVTNGATPSAAARVAFIIPSLERELLIRSERRCRSRAIVGVELDGAQKDCAIALQLETGNPGPVHEGLGILEFRSENWPRALAEFETVLKLNPKTSTSLYMKGLVERRMGNLAKGDADVAAATKADPHLTMQGRQAGLVP